MKHMNTWTHQSFSSKCLCFVIFISSRSTLKRTPSCSRLETGGKVKRGISWLSNIHSWRLLVQTHFYNSHEW